MTDIMFTFRDKKIGHKLSPGTYTARMVRTRINQRGNLEMTLTEVKPTTISDEEFYGQ